MSIRDIRLCFLQTLAFMNIQIFINSFQLDNLNCKQFITTENSIKIFDHVNFLV